LVQLLCKTDAEKLELLSFFCRYNQDMQGLAPDAMALLSKQVSALAHQLETACS
jgi:hypothetical protein